MIPPESRLDLPESIVSLDEEHTAKAPAGIPVEHVPPAPSDPGQIDLPARLLGDLLLKMLYRRGALSGEQLSDAVKLPFWALDPELLAFQHRRLVEVQGRGARGRRAYVFDLTTGGRQWVREILTSSPYVGPAPVSLDAYRAWTVRRPLRDTPVRAPDVARALADLVVDADQMRRLGPAVNAGRSLFIYGDPGNGKTSIAERIPSMYPGHIFIPYAVEMQGAIIQVYDPSVHEAVVPSEPPAGSGLMRPPFLYDPRFLLIRRPLVKVGGELTLDQLEPRWDDQLGSYRAPPQMKANGGVFLVDDFGRQRVSPRELLNRWMVPLDRGVDHLSLGGGQLLEVPFDCLVVFATNLDPSDLVEEAFYRRIRHKIRVQDPTPGQYRQIFRDICLRRGIHYEESAVEFIESEWYGRRGIPPRACHPAGILDDVCDLADYLGIPPTVDRKLLQQACDSYFIDAGPTGTTGTTYPATEDFHAH